MNHQPVYLTQEGLDKVRSELRELKAEKRPELAERLQKAKELGDLRENADYQEAKDELGRMEGRIIELEDIIRRVSVISASGAETIMLGAKVTVATAGKEKEFTIVGSQEAAPLRGLISNESPIGTALMGRRVGDSVEVPTPAGSTTYTIVAIA